MNFARLDWTRRALLKSAAACCTAPLAVAGKRWLPNNPLNVYMAESGTFGGDMHFSTGMLLLTTPQRHLRRIHQLRKQYNYFTSFRYSSNDRFRFNFVRDVLTAELNDPDTRFVMRVQNASDTTVTRATKVGSTYPYQLAYQDLFRRAVSVQQRIVVHAVNRTSRGADRYFYDSIAPMLTNEADFYLIHAWENDLMQLATVFTGCVHTDLNNPVDSETTHTKQRIINELKRQLGVSSFTTLGSRQKFQVILV